MGVIGGPGIVDDGLVLYLDSDNIDSYPGEPTENLIPNVGELTTGWSEHGWSGDFTVSADYENAFELTATNGWWSAKYDFGVSTGGNIHVGFYYKIKSNTTGNYGMYAHNGDHLGNYTTTIGTGTTSFVWKRFDADFTANADTKLAITLRGVDNSGTSDIIYIKDLQLEQKSHATPFVNGTRSATDGWKDLSGNGNHGDLTPMTGSGFDSNANMEFDGSSFVNVGYDYTPISAANHTISFWMKTGGDYTIMNTYWDTSRINIYTSEPNISYNLRGGNGVSVPSLFSTGGSVVDNTWHYIACVRNDDWMLLYIDGQLKSSTSGVTNMNTYSDRSTLGLGATGPYHADYSPSFIGKLDKFTIHSRALTANEVLQNYNSMKSKYI